MENKLQSNEVFNGFVLLLILHTIDQHPISRGSDTPCNLILEKKLILQKPRKAPAQWITLACQETYWTDHLLVRIWPGGSQIVQAGDLVPHNKAPRFKPQSSLFIYFSRVMEKLKKVKNYLTFLNAADICFVSKTYGNIRWMSALNFL
jgi:hypothetical protein